MGYSALVSVGVLVLGFPVQGIIVKFMFAARKKGIKITDGRVRLLQEVCLMKRTIHILILCFRSCREFVLLKSMLGLVIVQ